MGGRGGTSGFGSGNVVIHKQAEPNKQGYSYYMTGTRNVISNWDDEGNYHAKGIAKKRMLGNALTAWKKPLNTQRRTDINI